MDIKIPENIDNTGNIGNIGNIDNIDIDGIDNIGRKNKNEASLIHTDSIDNLDEMNMTGSLQNITIYRGSKIVNKQDYNKDLGNMDDKHNIERQLETLILDSDIPDDIVIDDDYVNKLIEDHNTIGISLLTKKGIATKELTESTKENSNVSNGDKKENMNDKVLSEEPLMNDSIFETREIDITNKINLRNVMREIIVIMIFHFLLGLHNAIFNIITIDGLVSCIIFYMNYIGVTKDNNFLALNRLGSIDRYIYYLSLFVGYYVFNYMTWYRFTFAAMSCASVLVCPSIMRIMYDVYAYKKIRQVLHDGYNNLVQKIICKQLSKILNIIIKNVLGIHQTIKYDDLIPYYNGFSWSIINKFIITFIIACIFNHIDRGGLKFAVMIYKNLYMKDAKYNIIDDKKYLNEIIADKRWDKFMDVYTLNRVIRMIVNDDAQNSMLSDQVTKFLSDVAFRFGRIMFCWTIMSVTNLFVGILSFFMFITNTKQPMRYLINTLVFAGLSFFTDEKLLVIMACELCYTFIESKVLTDVINDTYHSIRRGLLNVYYRTRLESVIMSFVLFYTSYYGYNTISAIIVSTVNLVLMTRLGFRIRASNNNKSFDPKKLSTVDEIFMNSINDDALDKINVRPDTDIDIDTDPDTNTNDKFHGITEDEEYEILMLPHSNNKTTKQEPFRYFGSIINRADNTMRPVPRLNTKTKQNQRKKDKKILDVIKIPRNNTNDINQMEASLIEDDIRMSKIGKSYYFLGDANNIENRDILLILKDRIKTTLKNNLLIRVLNPFVKVTTYEIIRITAHVFILLILGYISSFDVAHVTLLPIMVQNLIDLLF